MNKLIEVLYLGASDLYIDMNNQIEQGNIACGDVERHLQNMETCRVMRDIFERSIDILKLAPERLDYFQ